jgi:hypothetical protein
MDGKPNYRHRPHKGQKLTIKRLRHKPKVFQDRAGYWHVEAESCSRTLIAIERKGEDNSQLKG